MRWKHVQSDILYMFVLLIRRNQKGQLGLGNTETIGDLSGEMGEDLQDTDLGLAFVASQLVAGWNHNCALSNNSDVKCWG